jgi:hypothetical protein
MIRELLLEDKYDSGAASVKSSATKIGQVLVILRSVIANNASPATLHWCSDGQ